MFSVARLSVAARTARQIAPKAAISGLLDTLLSGLQKQLVIAGVCIIASDGEIQVCSVDTVSLALILSPHCNSRQPL